MTNLSYLSVYYEYVLKRNLKGNLLKKIKQKSNINNLLQNINCESKKKLK